MKEWIARLIGYMTEVEAKRQGFTHHGGMYGVPCWVGDPDGEAPMVATKWGPMEHFVTLGHWVSGLQMSLLGIEPHFAIAVGDELQPCLRPPDEAQRHR